ncbi:hypothetical protein CDD83_9345 [Cordyceps sp. RAO-2017]|nr:hypothetical protein CDD83_9345 [Cordyceps sp. RAO-2017]
MKSLEARQGREPDRASGRPRTACQQCNSLKVRCAGGKPSCFRCSRLRRHCVWPDDSGPPGLAGPRPLATPRGRGHAPEGSPVGMAIPPAIARKLVDAYFSKVYNATLLLHRPSFTVSLEAGTVCTHLLLSVCAMATCFYDAGNNCETPPRLEEETDRWAEEAGRILFAQINDSTEESLVSHLNLALYWYSRGRWQRAVIFEGNAGCVVRLLGLGLGPAAESGDSPLTMEITRRRFWAYFIINQFCNGMPGSPRLRLADFKGIALPCDEESFDLGLVPSPSQASDAGPQDASYFAEMVRLASIWASICGLVQDDSQDIGQKILAFHRLDGELRAWKANLHPALDLDHGQMDMDPSDDAASWLRLTTLHIGFHQAMCVAHSCVVPLFSLASFAPAESWGYLQTTSAQIAVSHARQISNIFIQSSGRPSIPAWGGFIGYAAYCSCAIQLPLLWCRSSSVRASACANIEANLETMRLIGKRWKLVNALTGFVPMIYNYHERMRHALPDKPEDFSSADLNRHVGISNRATVSILGHNAIVWSFGRVPAPDQVLHLDLDLAEHEDEQNWTTRRPSRQAITYGSVPDDAQAPAENSTALVPAVAPVPMPDVEPSGVWAETDLSIFAPVLDYLGDFSPFRETFGNHMVE